MSRRDPYGKKFPYSYHCDVENPMFVPDLSGQLEHHEQPCAECGGTGIEPDCEEDYPDDYHCTECDGEGKRGWGSWYREDRGLCGTCGADNALVSGMYEPVGADWQTWVCLVCYVRHHRDECGCALWKEAEKCLAIFLIE